MLSAEQKKEFYEALLRKDTAYEGIFFVGVKTTGVFCRPSCPARKPKSENCEFFRTAQEALLASFRPCKRCQPLSHPSHVSPLVRKLVEAIEQQPEKRWSNRDLDDLDIDASTARRQFQKRFGMTFVEYARARRMGLAMKNIRAGASVLDAQLTTGYESGSGFRDAFSRIMGEPPARAGQSTTVLKTAWLDTPLGPMITMADEDVLWLLEFVDRRGLEREIERLRQKYHAMIVPGTSAPIESIEKELQAYYSGTLTNFETPIRFCGSPFQTSVWQALQAIPHGETRSYAELAQAVGRPTATRAVANANGANQLAIIVPCHRVIRSNGDLGGYAGGLSRKQWLIDHEKMGMPNDQ
ncbi:bifunctional transcriptional activator/DNA repair protein Ada [Bacillaceae bacterium SIJ1]|uniref:bifunctional transcriptional activator/DNA repair enzyme AdaA n=1 Tax=Litoribacterium kuwaitense TaxID=1398745 RepID=UPI0013E9E094|nr:trifunctional transcriptional activator/DNA repair protein Ada/methylated-DNA--[protein]-cysteine S-methyltransferase [Litoribacterium kuwaitense]NGP45935.1 bifunctional transcriptional activator/DNA repair protein Ada [Litoribacterium kuwaitense]